MSPASKAAGNAAIDNLKLIVSGNEPASSLAFLWADLEPVERRRVCTLGGVPLIAGHGANATTRDVAEWWDFSGAERERLRSVFTLLSRLERKIELMRAKQRGRANG